MSNAWLENMVTEEEEREFAEQGYMVIEDAIRMTWWNGRPKSLTV